MDPVEMIDRINGVFGRHGGARALHAKGIVLRGTFTATPAAAGLTRAEHMQGGTFPVTVRVSNGSGRSLPDYAPDVRGCVAKIYLPDGSRTDISAQTSPRFPVRTPEAFAQMVEATEFSASSLLRFPLFAARHPRAVRSLPAGLAASKPPTSYASRPYFAIHAYRWLDAHGGSRWVRYTIVPEAEEPYLPLREARSRGRDYLQDEIRERLARGPVRMHLDVQIAGEGDDPHDPTKPWPDSRESVRAGTFELTEEDTSRERGDDVLVFDPVRTVDGIELSEDPILLFRTRAYSESVRRRSGRERPAGYDGSPSTGGR